MADREMTNEEAIEILSGIRAYYNIFYEYDEPMYAALSKAISALKAEHVKHGHWEEKYVEDADIFLRRRFYCSACGGWQTYGKTHYCPNCGAKMEGVKEI